MSSRKNQEMIMKERLVRERDNLLREREALENKIAGLEIAISLVGEDHDGEIVQANGKRVATKSIVLELLHDVGLTGLNSNNAVEMAARRGITLDKASVSSLLSRLKKDDVLEYDREKYRLKHLSKLSEGVPVSRPVPSTVRRIIRVRMPDGSIVNRTMPPPSEEAAANAT